VTVVVNRSIPPTVNNIYNPWHDGETTRGPVGWIGADFSKTMDPNTVTTSTFTLVKHESDGSTTPVDATVSWSISGEEYRFVSLRFPSYLEGGTKYTATIKGGPEGVKDALGIPLAQDYVWSFTTATWPTVNSVSPSDGATQVPTNSNVTATFTKDMQWYLLMWPVTNCTGCIQRFTLVKEGSTTPVDATVIYGAGSTATMDPSGELEGNTKYTATVKGGPDGVEDAWSNPLADDKVWSFTTGEVTPPETTIDSGPSGTVSSTTASFSFSSNEGDASFECKLDNEAFKSCTSPKSVPDEGFLTEGTHTFEVRATDTDGNTDPTPDSRTWTVDAPPETTIGSGPPAYERSTSASFSFSSSEAGSTFQCSRDGSTFSACTSPKSYSSLSQGNHTFRVRAIGTAGNIDASPATRSWFVDTVVPKGTILINGGAASTSSRTVTLRLSASDPSPASGVAYMRFRNEGTTTWSSWFDYTSSHSWTLSAGAGTKTVYVQYKDQAGNNSAAASDTIKFSP
jgi:hypothetical protein